VIPVSLATSAPLFVTSAKESAIIPDALPEFLEHFLTFRRIEIYLPKGHYCVRICSWREGTLPLPLFPARKVAAFILASIEGLFPLYPGFRGITANLFQAAHSAIPLAITVALPA